MRELKVTSSLWITFTLIYESTHPTLSEIKRYARESFYDVSSASWIMFSLQKLLGWKLNPSWDGICDRAKAANVNFECKVLRSEAPTMSIQIILCSVPDDTSLLMKICCLHIVNRTKADTASIVELWWSECFINNVIRFIRQARFHQL